jgi:hypothetical protein
MRSCTLMSAMLAYVRFACVFASGQMLFGTSLTTNAYTQISMTYVLILQSIQLIQSGPHPCLISRSHRIGPAFDQYYIPRTASVPCVLPGNLPRLGRVCFSRAENLGVRVGSRQTLGSLAPWLQARISPRLPCPHLSTRWPSGMAGCLPKSYPVLNRE